MALAGSGTSVPDVPASVPVSIVPDSGAAPTGIATPCIPSGAVVFGMSADRRPEKTWPIWCSSVAVERRLVWPGTSAGDRTGTEPDTTDHLGVSDTPDIASRMPGAKSRVRP